MHTQKNENDYKKLPSKIECSTGISIPHSEPSAGVELKILRPNPDAYPPENSFLNFTYLGGNNAIVEDEFRYADDESETYCFFNSSEEQLQEFQRKSRKIRAREVIALTQKVYMNSSGINDSNHQTLIDWGFDNWNRMLCKENEDYAPSSHPNIKMGGLRAINNNIVQFFWGKNPHENDHKVEIIAYRIFKTNLTIEETSGEYLESCLHVHQVSYKSSADVYTVGLKNALKLKKDMPSYSVFEFFDLESLANFKDGHFYSHNTRGDLVKKIIIALDEDQMSDFNQLLINKENEHSQDGLDLNHIALNMNRIIDPNLNNAPVYFTINGG